MSDTIQLRVYHRTQKDITLLWSTEKMTEDQINNTKIVCGGKELSFIRKQHEDRRGEFSKGTMVCVIPHEENGLNPSLRYEISLVFGTQKASVLVRKVMVLEYGVLPMFEKDSKKAHVQLMGFDIESKTWAKLPLIRTEHGYAVPMVIVDDYREKAPKLKK